MAENSKIEWTDHTFNPWIGCTKVSPGCDNCYAEARMDHRLKQVQWGPHGERKRTSAAYWRAPMAWDRKAAAAGVRHRVFCASLADLFDNAVPSEWRADLFDLIKATPNLDWLLLTKRPQNIAKYLPSDWDSGYPNVWLGTSVENQTEADRRIPELLNVPAVVRFLSMEPLLGPVDLREITDGDGTIDALTPSSWQDVWDQAYAPEVTGTTLDEAIEAFSEVGPYPPTDIKGPSLDWVIVGGESGPGARPMHPDWARSLRDQCAKAGVPFFMKQMAGEVKSKMPAIPDDLMIREMPNG